MSRPLRSRLAPIVLLLAAGAGLWFVWTTGDRSTGARAVDVDTAVEDGEGAAVESDLADVAERESEGRSEIVAAAPAVDDSTVAPRTAASVGAELVGRVLQPDGAAAPSALVALISLHDDQPGNRGDRSTVRADDRGRFRIEVPGWAKDTRVLMAARATGYAPWSERVSIDGDFVAREHELTLGLGHALSGRVVRDGRPVPEARISIDVAYGTGGVFDAGSESWWADGQLHEKHGHATTDADGLFRVPGMGPYAHRLEVVADDGERPRVAGRLYSIEAPDDRVYDLTGARLSISVLGGGGALEGANVHVSSGGHGVIAQSTVEPVEVEVPPDAQVSVDVSHPMARPQRVEFTSPAAGRLHDVAVTLEMVTRPSMTIVLPGASGAGIERVGVRLQVLNGFSDDAFDALPTGATDTFHVETVTLDPARYNVVLEPGSGDGVTAYLAPRHQEVELPAEGDVRVEFDLELYGRVQVRPKLDRSESWSIHYVVRDDSGGTHLDRHLWHHAVGGDFPGGLDFEESFGLRWNRRFRMWDDAGEAARRIGVLPPGTYTLTVESDGYSTWTGPITIEGGRTTEVDVTLQPASD